VARYIISLLLLVPLFAHAETYSCTWMEKGDERPTISKVDVNGSTAKVVINRPNGIVALHDFKVFKNDEEELLLVKPLESKKPGETKTAGASLIPFIIDKMNMESAYGYFGTKAGVELVSGRCIKL
jgi:hypothetical protein